MTGLGKAGQQLYDDVVGSLPEGWQFTSRELAILMIACRQADDLVLFEQAIAEHGAMTTGARGQLVLNPAAVEARQARAAIARIVAHLGVVKEDQSATSKSDKARKAANTRWHGA